MPVMLWVTAEISADQDPFALGAWYNFFCYFINTYATNELSFRPHYIFVSIDFSETFQFYSSL